MTAGSVSYTHLSYHAEDTMKRDIENRLKKEKNHVSIMGKRV